MTKSEATIVLDKLIECELLSDELREDINEVRQCIVTYFESEDIYD